MEDTLRLTRNLYYTGNFDEVVLLGDSISKSQNYGNETLNLYILLAKFRLSQKNEQLLEELRNSSIPMLKALYLLKKHEVTNGSAEALDEIISYLHSLGCRSDSLCHSLIACRFLALGDLTRAIQEVQNGSIELQAIRLWILLMADRVDLAENLLREMPLEDEDTVSKLCLAWILLATGEYGEAFLTFKDIHNLYLIENSAEDSTLLVNCEAVAYMHRKMWQKAFDILKRKDYVGAHYDIETLTNLICCSRRLQMPEKADYYYRLLDGLQSDHFLVKGTKALEDAFKVFDKETNFKISNH